MKTQNDKVLQDIVEMFKANNINYWLCHGTLLGIIRENRLLPWDHDIDFAVWGEEHTKEEILKLFSSNRNFKETIVSDEMSSLHLLTADKRVDINFYTKDNEKAFIRWIAPGNVLFRLRYFAVTFINSDFGIKHTAESSTKIMQLVKQLISILLIVVKYILPKNIKLKMLKNLNKKLHYAGYSYPLNLMKFKEIYFLGISVSVPIQSEKTLEVTYGADWKTPKKDYIWYKEGKNLLKSEE